MLQEEGFESDDEKHMGKSGSLVRVDLRGSDSEEDNAAAGGGIQVNILSLKTTSQLFLS